MKYLILLFLLPPVSALAQEKVKIGQYLINVSFDKRSSQLSVKRKGKLISQKSLKTDQNPSLNKLQKFESKGIDYIVLDIQRGYTFGSMNETHCSEVSLWKLSKAGQLSMTQKEIYQCEVNSSKEVFKAKEFYHPYTLNKKIPRIEYLKVP
jgi:hypothetical protein